MIKPATRTISVSVSTAKEEITVNNALVDAVATELEKAGFTIEAGTTSNELHYIYVGWRGKRVLYFCAGSAKNYFRLASAYSGGSWGSTYSDVALSTVVGDEYNLKIYLAYFATGETVYIRLWYNSTSTPPAHFSIAAIDQNGDKTVINGRDITGSAMLVPFRDQNMNSAWAWTKKEPTVYYPEDGKCYVESGFAVYSTDGTGKPWYITDDLITVATNATFSVGQTIMLDGVEYINLGGKTFVKWCEDD